MREGVLVGLGEEQHVADHARDALVFLEVRGQDVLVFVERARPRQRDLGLGHQVRDRRTQFVGYIRRIIAEPLESGFEPSEHAIEGFDVVAHFQRRIIDGETLAELPCRQPTGSFGDPAQGGEAPVRSKPAE